MPEHKGRSTQIAAVVALCLMLLLSQTGYSPLRAGEPMRVGSTLFGTDGVVIVWPAASLPIAYRTDGGPLGLDSNATTTARVNTLFGVWQAVPTATIAFTNAGAIPTVTGCAAPATDFTDGDVDTFGEFLCVGSTGNPIIYDNTGVIHDALFGAGNSTLGFAGPTFSTAGGGTIIAARAVLNGNFRDGTGPQSSDTEFEATILHELGHYIGLGHSQINVNCLTAPFVAPCNNFGDDTFGLPTMFPIAISGLQESAGVAPERTLSMDDIAWVSRLYPDATFATTHGTIGGTVFFSDGVTHLQGVNVIARQVDNPATPAIDESRRNAVSGVSGYLYTGNRGLDSGFLDQANSAPMNSGDSGGSRNVAFRGTYDIPVPAVVSYNISVEAVDPSFVGASSVGPLGRQAGETFGLPGAAPAPLSGIGPIVAGSTSGGNNLTFPTTPTTKDALDAVASNDTPGTATPITNGTRSASISPFGNVSASAPDVDVYSFTALANTTVTFEIFARRLVAPPIPSTLDSVVEIVDATGTRLSLCDTAVDAIDGIFDDPCVNDDITAGTVLDSRLSFRSPSALTAFVRVLDVRGDARPDMIYDLTVTGAGQAPPPVGCTSDFDGGLGIPPGTDWNTAANWNPDGVPTGSSDVCIGAAFTVNHAGTDTINKLQNIAGTLNLTGGALTVNGTASVGGTLSASAGSATFNGTTNITNLSLTGGTTTFSGTTASITALTFNSGTLNASSGTVTLPVAGYTHAGGTLRLNGGSVSTAGTITQTGGLIQGGSPGTLTANINQTGGTIGPGLSPGILNVTGNFTQTAAGTVQIELGGTTVGTQYDQLNATGTAVVDGTFNVVLINAFVPNIGDTFTIASAAGGGSGNNTINFPTLPAGRTWLEAGTPTSLIIQVVAASACTINFDNSAGTGLWQTATNWNTDTLPINTDDVCIGAGFTVTKSAAGGDFINRLTVDNAAGVFTLSADLSIAAASTIGTAGFTHSSGTLTGPGALTISGPFNWSFATQTGGGVTTANGGLNITGFAILDGRTLTNTGNATMSGAGNLAAGNSAVVNNSGSFDIQNSGGIGGSVGGTSSFNNSGTLTKSGGAATSFINSTLNHTGTINANSQILQFNRGGTSSGSFVVNAVLTFGGLGGAMDLNIGTTISGPGRTTATGTVNFNSGSSITTEFALAGAGIVSFNTGAPVTLPNLFHVGGTITGGDTINVTSLFTWSGGTQAGAGITNANGTLDLTGGLTLDSRTLNSFGTSTFSFCCGASLSITNGAVWNNNGTIDAQRNGQPAISNSGIGTGTINNIGVFKRTVGGGTFAIDNVALNNTGSVNVNSGTLQLNGGGSSTGSFAVDIGTVLEFGGGTHNLNSGAAITGAGTTSVTGGTANFNTGSSINTVATISGGTMNVNTGATVTLPTLTQSVGTLGGTGTVAITGVFAWSGGSQTGAGITNANGGMTLDGSTKTLSGARILNNLGTATWSAGDISSGEGSAFNNSGTLNVTASAAPSGLAFDNSLGGAVAQFNNSGTLNMAPAVWRYMNFLSTPLNNTGAVNVTAGTLLLGGGGTSTGSFTVTAPGGLDFSGGTHTLTGASSINGPGTGTVTVTFSGGTVNLAGTYNVTNVTDVSGATVNFTGTVTSFGLLQIYAGAANFSTPAAVALSDVYIYGGTLGGTGTVNVTGLLTWSGGTMTGTGTTNANGGIALDGGPRTFGGGRILNNAGVATLTLGSFISGQGAVFNNLATGTFDAQTGFNFTTGLGGARPQFNNAGTFSKSAGGSSVSMEAQFNNTGTVSVTASSVSFQGGGTSSGSFTVGAGSTITFYGISHTFTAASSISGAGSVAFAWGGASNVAGTYNVTGNTFATSAVVTFTGTVTSTGTLGINVNGSANFNTPAAATVQSVDLSSGTLDATSTVNITGPLNFSNGTLSGTGTVNVTGLFTWSGGTQTGAGTTNANGGMTLSSGGSKTLNNGRILNNAGAATWTDGEFFIGNGAVFTNLATGVFDIQHATNRQLGGGVGGVSTVNNAGTMTKSAGGTRTPVNANFTNTGALNVNNGTMYFIAAFTQTAGSTTLNGGNIDGAISFFFDGGTLGGVGTITTTGNVFNNGAIVSPGLTPGTLNITGNYIQTAGGSLNIELGGFTPGTQFDVLAITGSATLGGTLNVLSLSSFSPGAGVSFQVMTFASRTGDFATKTGLNIATPALIGLPQATSYLLSNAVDADMSVTKTDSPDPVTVGQNVTYTITVSNAGPGPGTSAVLNDPLPASTTFVSLAAAAGWACTTPAVGANGTVNCTNPSVASGANHVFTLVVATTGASVPSISNTATVSATENDPTPAGNSATAATTVNPLTADLSVTKADAPDPVRVGNNLTYTVTVTNNGPNNATGVTLTNTLPANVTFVSATPSQGTCSQAAGVVTCPLGAINNGANATVQIVVTPGAAAVPSINSSTSVTGTEADPSTANNTATQATTVQPVADLSITKTDAPDPLNVGSNLTYTITVTNNGPNSATGIAVTDAVPAGLTFVSATATQGTCALAAGTITCNVGTLANGATATATVVVTAGAAAVPSVTNTVNVTATEFDPNTANNSATATTTVNPVADLVVTKSDSPDPVAVSTNLTYSIVVANNGPSQATGVTLTDTLPAGVTFVSSTPSAGTCSGTTTVTCNLGTINSGANVTVTIVVTAPAAAGSLSNTASVTSGVTDPNAANNSATATTTIGAADFSISASPAFQTIFAGLQTGYTVTLTPNGSFTGTAVLTCENLPLLVSCAVTPPSLALSGTTPQTAVVTISTTASGTGAPRGERPAPPALPNPRILLAWLFALLAALMLNRSLRDMRRYGWARKAVQAAAILVLTVISVGCSIGGMPGTQSGTYVITIRATSGATSHTATVTLIVR